VVPVRNNWYVGHVKSKHVVYRSRTAQHHVLAENESGCFLRLPHLSLTTWLFRGPLRRTRAIHYTPTSMLSFNSLTLRNYFSRPARIPYLVCHCNFITDQQGREDMIRDDITTRLRSRQPALPPCIRNLFISQCPLFLVFLGDDCGRLS
jgi:hypothetical protein